MVLVGSEHRGADEQAPDKPQRAQPRRQFRPVEAANNKGEDDVQRGHFVVSLIESGKRAEKRGEEAVANVFRPADLQREKQKTADGDSLRGEQLRNVAVLFVRTRAEEETEAVEEVERPVRDDGPRQEGDVVFPSLSDFRNVGAARGVMVGEAVAEVEDGGDGGEFEQGGDEGGFVHGMSSFTIAHSILCEGNLIGGKCRLMGFADDAATPPLALSTNGMETQYEVDAEQSLRVAADSLFIFRRLFVKNASLWKRLVGKRWFGHPGLQLFGEIFVVNAVEDKAVVFEFVAVFTCNFFEAFSNSFVIEFNDFTGFHTDEVIVMVAVVDFKDAVVALKVVPFEDARLFELSENAVHGGEADVFIRFEQDFIHVFCTEVAIVVRSLAFHDFKDFHPRPGHFQSGFFYLRTHVVFVSV